ncbi:AAA family ATPase [Hansschlegelia sp.]|uniref:bifunctional aminoglycoside phosphotransferase/ATP-binding protein n=1 Tax=Hansschlegelia sp. TaxID=2041892 RepID=UPI002C973256|nr:AAA family ATPase [Hansschlegelia sp.]HVI27424.1 AAA family ATPase [Hansschlegelia sp.]
MDDHEQGQQATIAFLKSRLGDAIDEIRTHISVILLAPDRVWKLKRAVALPYVDLTEAGTRVALCERELRLNRETAPSLYRRVLRVTRGPHGLELDGNGEPIDAVVEMARFPAEDLFDRIAAESRLTGELTARLAETIARFHGELPPVQDRAASRRLAAAIEGDERALRGHARSLGAAAVDDYCARCREAFRALEDRLDARGRSGAVVLGHGDLHLGNICLWEGAPTLFDRLEFDEELATVDRLYDLAFLLMDLGRRSLPERANLLLNRYLDRIDDEAELAALPLFMSVRAAIRAHVSASQSKPHEASAFLALAGDLLQPGVPMLVAIGGLSGSGKSTVATALAPHVGSRPGARVIGTDRMRKAMFGVAPETRLPAEAYARRVTDEVYAGLARRAAAILNGGWSVIVEGTFLSANERARVQSAATAAGAAFVGLWLDVDPGALRRRVAQRRGDVSDADLSVLEAQLGVDLDAISWVRIDASGSEEDVIRRARDALSRPGPGGA